MPLNGLLFSVEETKAEKKKTSPGGAALTPVDSTEDQARTGLPYLALNVFFMSFMSFASFMYPSSTLDPLWLVLQAPGNAFPRSFRFFASF